MELLKFKTNLTSEENVATVTPMLDKKENISQWNVDTDDADHILSITGNDVDPQQVENLLQEAGFSAELLQVIGMGGSDL
ncbi:hypothetical protein [Catalinimonas alkaloidigena]|nr:hypothetical protein [Catalinimonas alkaloidigena]